MRAKKAYVLLLVAYGLALLHSTIPHQHSSRGTTNIKFEVRTAADNSLLGLLLGCGHLESFTKGDPGVDVDHGVWDAPAVYLASVYVTELPLVNPRNSRSPFVDKLHARTLLLSSRQFRAPPFVA
jgi:hypothetical protein